MNITLNEYSVFYTTGGRCFKPQQETIIFIHGAALNSTVWALFARHYARHNYNVVALDLPGHGHSQGPPLNRIEDISAWLAALMDTLRIERATLVGHSLGSLVCIDMTIRYSEKVTQIILLGSSLPMPVGEAFLAAAKDNKPSTRDMFLHFGFGYNAQLGNRSIAGINLLNMGKRWLEATEDGVMHAGLSACNHYRPTAKALAAIDCKTDIIMGEEDAMTPLTSGLALAETIPYAQLTALKGCGHMAMLEHPEAVCRALACALMDN